MTESTGNLPGRIFVSYRREDTAFPAGWLYDRLVSHFGKDQVFKDIDSIVLGDDFIEVITTAVGSCDVLLALIGGRWLTITSQDGQRRLDNPDDFVRLEIETALARDVRVIPILVDVDRMPRPDELPPSLTKLARRHALELSPNRFDADTRRLLRVLDRTIAQAQEQARHDAKEEAAARQRQVEQLQGQLRERAAVQDWQAVLAASQELAALDPAAADPDGLASAAREQITRRQEAEEKARQEAEEAAARQRQVEQLQGQLRERAAVQDWQAVLAASQELVALDPAAADPDGLASAAREQITRRQEAEERARQEAEERARQEAEERARQEAEERAREEDDRQAREEEARQARKEATREAQEAARLQAAALDFLATIEKVKSGLDSAGLANLTGAELVSPPHRKLADQNAEPGPSLRGDAVVQLGSIFEDSAGQSRWTANLLKSSNHMRRLIVTLSNETHTLEVKRREVGIDSILLDGKAIIRRHDIADKMQTFSISDGQQLRTAELRVMSLAATSRITSMKLIVDGHALYLEHG